MEADNENPSQVDRFHVVGLQKTSMVKNKKRKLQIDQMDILRPKHKCRVRGFSSEHASMFADNLELERMHNHMVKGKADASVLDDRSEPESAKDSNSFAEDSDPSMSVNEEVKLEVDCAKTYLYGRPSTSFVNWDGYNVKVNKFSVDVSTAEKTSSSEEDSFMDGEHNQSYHDTDIQALQNLDDQLLGLGNHTDNVYSEYAKDSGERSLDEEIEDIVYSNGMNPNMYVLSSGRWKVDQEAQSNSTRPPTIDKEFEQYFSMLML